jgi:hypothetical protein
VRAFYKNAVIELFVAGKESVGTFTTNKKCIVSMLLITSLLVLGLHELQVSGRPRAAQ